jgi:hypothetical protein
VRITNWLQIGYVALVAAVFALRVALRVTHDRRRRGIQID